MDFIDKLKERSEALGAVAEACQYILRNDEVASEARDYLDTRLSRSAQDKYGFGYFPDDDSLKFLFSLASRELLESEGLVYRSFVGMGHHLHGHFSKHNLVCPLRDVHGNISALLGRTLLSDSERERLELKKYKYTRGYSSNLYLFGLNLAKETIIEKDYVICVEGQLDCIACQEAGIMNVVALGKASLSRYQFSRLHRYTNNIFLMLDNDEPGQEGKRIIKAHYLPFGNVKSISVPNGYKDIDEFLRKEGSHTWRQTVINGLSALQPKES